MSDLLEQDDHLPPHLVKAHKAFLAGEFHRERIGELDAWGQPPHSLVIGCCYSPVEPEQVFSAAPGEIFDLRNIANLLPPYAPEQAHVGVWAAVEYAVETLKVRNIVVLGHEHCFGALAALSGAGEKESKGGAGAQPTTGLFGSIVQAAHLIEHCVFHDDAAHADDSRIDRDLIESLPTPVARAADDPEQLALLSVLQCLRNLRADPNVSRREGQGALALHGAYYSLESRRLLALHEGRRRFVPVAAEVYAIALRTTDR